MKNWSLLLFLFLVACGGTVVIPPPEPVFPEVKDLSEYPQTEFLMTLEHQISKDKNAVYCVPIVYAWEGVRKVINKPLVIDKGSKDLVLLNNTKSFVNVLKPEEYETEVQVEDSKISSKAWFKKSLPFEEKLTSFDKELSFDKTPVASFGTFGYDSQVDILYYKNDKNFVIALTPTDKLHQIILFKSEKSYTTMAKMFAEVEANTTKGKTESENEKLSWKYHLEAEDEVVIPKFKFNIHADYTQLQGNTFQAENETYAIASAWQETAFILDEAGAIIESIGEMETETTAIEEEEEKPHPKKMRFDKPFFVLLKRTDAKHPYFCMWVANTELMVKE